MDEEKASTPSPRPTPIQRELTEVSALYDLQGKGYLDETERALRRMDSDNQGFLNTSKVYMIMESLQHEQSKSAELIQTIQQEQKKSMNLRKALIAMCVFAVLLALANIGTSFAAATLAKDTTTSTEGDLVTLDGVRVATTNKYVTITVEPVEESARRSRRHLTELEQSFCSTLTEGVVCTAQGEFYESDVADIMQQLCPERFFGMCQGGVPQLDLQCHGAVTEIRGGLHVPQGGPTYWIDPALGIPYNIYPYASSTLTEAGFPTYTQGFYGVQSVPRGLGQPDCEQIVDLVFFCPTDGLSTCLAMELFTPTCNIETPFGTVKPEIQICGPEPVPVVTPQAAAADPADPASGFLGRGEN